MVQYSQRSGSRRSSLVARNRCEMWLGGPDLARVEEGICENALQAPDSADAGTTEFTLRNQGRLVHELVIGLLRPGTGARQMLEAAKRNARLRDLGDLYLEGPPFGAVLTWPNATSPGRLTVDLRPGRDYAPLCQLHDSAQGPHHSAMGMVRVLHVR